MYTLKVKSGFSAAHFLKDYKGKCENIHGHNWDVQIEIRGEKLDNYGLLIDFRDLKNELKGILETFDHKLINDIDYFKDKNPSCENISRSIFEALEDKFKKFNIELSEVTVWETPDSSASYRK